MIHVGVLLLLAVAGARYATSNYFVKAALASGSLEESKLAVDFQTENPLAHDARGAALVQNDMLAAASEGFEKAIAASPNDYRLSLHLCQARARAGELESGLDACLRAGELAPHYSSVNMQTGELYLATGRADRAFEFFSKAVRNDQSHFAEVLNYASNAFAGDSDSIWRAVDPTSTKAKSIVTWYFLDRLWNSEQSRAFILSDELTREEKDSIIRFLIEKKNYPLAREIWLSKMSPEAAAGANALLFDGGFESITESDPSGLGWQIDKSISFTTVARDQSRPHSGRAALDIRFAGNVEVRHSVFSQIAFVDPGKTYTLTFFTRSEDLVSASLPIILVVDPVSQLPLARSAPLDASREGWIQRSVSFTAPESRAVVVSLQRPDCSVSPCPIVGAIAIDDFSLSPSAR